MSKQNWKVGETYDTVGGSSVRRFVEADDEIPDTAK